MYIHLLHLIAEKPRCVSTILFTAQFGLHRAQLKRFQTSFAILSNCKTLESLSHVGTCSHPAFSQGSADPKQKPVLRHVIVKDLNKAPAEIQLRRYARRDCTCSKMLRALKVAAQLKYEVPTTGLFERKLGCIWLHETRSCNLPSVLLDTSLRGRKPPMGLYCVFDGLSRAGVGVAGPASAELLSGTCPTPTILKLQAVFLVSEEVQATVPANHCQPIKPATLAARPAHGC